PVGKPHTRSYAVSRTGSTRRAGSVSRVRGQPASGRGRLRGDSRAPRARSGARAGAPESSTVGAGVVMVCSRAQQALAADPYDLAVHRAGGRVGEPGDGLGDVDG